MGLPQAAALLLALALPLGLPFDPSVAALSCAWYDVLCHAQEFGEALFGWTEDVLGDLWEKVVAIIVGFWLAIFDAFVEGITWLGEKVAEGIGWVILAPVRAFQAFLTWATNALRGLGLAAPVAATLVFVLVAVLIVIIAIAVRFAAERIWELL